MSGVLKSLYGQFGFFLILLLLTGWVYRHMTYAVPRGDQYFFLQERSLDKDNASYLRRMISYSRMRKIEPGDGYLFRPAATGLLALQDIQFRSDFRTRGILSLGFHVLVGFVLFLVALQFLPPPAAALVGLVFCIQYTGMEAFLWRHIAPYTLGFFFFLLGVWQLGMQRREESAGIKVGCLFVLATLFFDLLAYSLLLAAMVLWYVSRRVSDGRYQRSLRLCLVSFGIFISLNFLDYFISGRVGFAGPADSLNFSLLLSRVPKLFLLAGAHAHAFFVSPFLSGDFEGNPFSRLMISVLQWGDGSLVIFGSIFFAVCYLAFRKMMATKSGPGAFIVLSALLGQLVFFFVGRVLLRDLYYLDRATYYYYFSNLLLLLLVAYLLSDTAIFRKTSLKAFFVVLALAYTGGNYWQIQRATRPMGPPHRCGAELTTRIAQVVDESPHLCFMRPSREIEKYMPYLEPSLYFQSCRSNKRRGGLELVANDKQEASLRFVSRTRAPYISLNMNIDECTSWYKSGWKGLSQ